VVFSSQAVILPLDGIPSLVFRIGNQRANQVVEAKINVSVLLTEQTSEGESFRNFYDLKLERNFSPIFALTWTIVHPIDSSSPLYGKTKKDLEDARAMILISFTGIDETFSQTVYSRFAYTPKDMVWNRRFKDILHFNPDGTVRVAIEDIHLTEDARVN
jgi:inward rectifier potassium channel